jgi:hypothetical protein
MKLGWRRSSQEPTKPIKQPCRHPLALVIDPTDGELRELEAMLAKCPNCSRWAPGDGPIMATLSSTDKFRDFESKAAPAITKQPARLRRA